jgi:dTDP-4-amino-4,6-dideoxygalactose transaminase
MIPRGVPDLSWSDLAAGALGLLRPGARAALQARVEAAWSSGDTLACLSVRTGLDLLLQALALPHGSEVLVSAITIRDMVRILEHHGLVAVPLDVHAATLAVDASEIERAIRPRTRALLVAHLFGSRMPLDPLIQVAQRHGLVVIEDCAQAYDGSSFRGHPQSDVSMFSFGPIKTATALGGALLRFKDRALLRQVRRLEQQYPLEPRSALARRLALFALLKLLARPLVLGLFVVVCRLRGLDHDGVLSGAVRGFAGGDLLLRLRRRPCAPLLRLLDRRLARASRATIDRRVSFARRLRAGLPVCCWPGSRACEHTHWVLPIESAAPEALVRLLWARGFDATRRASSLVVVPSPDDRAARRAVSAECMLERLIYLPVYPAMSATALARLQRIVTDFEEAWARL